jgi:tetratricopeptide (TPR) repeat protein
MGGMSKSTQGPGTAAKTKVNERQQLDFELEFFAGILDRFPDYVDVLRVYGNLLTRRGRILEGLDVDRRIVRLRPQDPVAHYNIACSLCLLKKHEQALAALRKAIELGYRDFAYLRKDKDLDAIKTDPRYKQLLREFGVR